MPIRLTLAALLLASTAGLALAQSAAPGSTEPNTEPSASPSAKPGTESTTKPVTAPDTAMPSAQSGAATTAQATKDMKEWQVAKLVKTSATDAIGTAEAQGEKGGKAIDVDFEKADSKDPAHYSIKVVYPSGKLVEYGINADTGALFKTENQPIERYFTFLTPANFNEAKTSLRDALAIAEKTAGGGKAYEAEVSKDGKAVQYEVKVAGADKEQGVKVGPDGKAKLD